MAYRKGETAQERQDRDADQLYDMLVKEWRMAWEDFPFPQLAIHMDQAKAHSRRRFGSGLFAPGLMGNLVQRRKLYKMPGGMGLYWPTDGTPGCPEAAAWASGGAAEAETKKGGEGE